VLNLKTGEWTIFDNQHTCTSRGVFGGGAKDRVFVGVWARILEYDLPARF